MEVFSDVSVVLFTGSSVYPVQFLFLAVPVQGRGQGMSCPGLDWAAPVQGVEYALTKSGLEGRGYPGGEGVPYQGDPTPSV